MSVKHNKAGGGNAEVKKELQEVKKETQEVKAAGESTAALLAMYFKAQIVQDRAAGTEAITDEMILQSAEVIDYPEYEDAHAYNTVGEIIKYNGRYYEIIAPHTSNSVSYSDAFITTGSGGTAASVKVGSKVRLKQGAKTYDGKSLASFVYNRDHVVKEISGDRVVITYGGVVVAAVKLSDLTLV